MIALKSKFIPGQDYQYIGPSQKTSKHECTLQRNQIVRCLKASSEFAIAIDFKAHNSPTIIVPPQHLKAIIG